MGIIRPFLISLDNFNGDRRIYRWLVYFHLSPWEIISEVSASKAKVFEFVGPLEECARVA